MRKGRSSQHGQSPCRYRIVVLCGLIAACAGPPALVSVSPVYQVTNAPAADTSGPVVAEIRPSGPQGEFRFVVVPPEQAVRP